MTRSVERSEGDKGRSKGGYSRHQPWMSELARAAELTGDVAGACKAQDISLAELHRYRQLCPEFAEEMSAADVSTRLAIRANLEAQAAQGNPRAVSLYLRRGDELTKLSAAADRSAGPPEKARHLIAYLNSPEAHPYIVAQLDAVFTVVWDQVHSGLGQVSSRAPRPEDAIDPAALSLLLRGRDPWAGWPRVKERPRAEEHPWPRSVGRTPEHEAAVGPATMARIRAWEERYGVSVPEDGSYLAAIERWHKGEMK